MKHKRPHLELLLKMSRLFPWAFGLLLANAAPEINVPGVRDGQVTPINIGSAFVGSTSPTKIFTVQNQGSTTLSIEDVAVPKGFVLTRPPAPKVAPSKQTTFTIGLSTLAAGTPAGRVVIRNSDADEARFDFPISGSVKPVPTAIIAVDGVTNHQHEPVKFGSIVSGAHADKTFHVRNLGGQPLTVSVREVPGGYTVVRSPRTPIPPGQESPMTLRLNGSTPGTFLGNVVLGSNSRENNPFVFAVSGSVRKAMPEVQVYLDGSPVSSSPVDTYLVWAYVGSQNGEPLQMTIKNLGSDPLIFQNWAAPNGFTAIPSLPSSISPGGKSSFAILPLALGRHAGTVSFRCNDADEPNFSVKVVGTGFPIPTDAPGDPISGRFGGGEAVIYTTANTRYAIEPPNGPCPRGTHSILRSYGEGAQPRTSTPYDGLVTRIVFYIRPGVTIENYVGLSVDRR